MKRHDARGRGVEGGSNGWRMVKEPSGFVSTTGRRASDNRVYVEYPQAVLKVFEDRCRTLRAGFGAAQEARRCCHEAAASARAWAPAQRQETRNG